MIPQVAPALRGWGRTCDLRAVTKTVSDFEVEEALAAAEKFSAVLVPLPAQKLAAKPEGMRTWRWWTVYTTKDLGLDDKMVDDQGLTLRVMTKGRWGDYFEYEAAENPGTI